MTNKVSQATQRLRRRVGRGPPAAGAGAAAREPAAPRRDREGHGRRVAGHRGPRQGAEAPRGRRLQQLLFPFFFFYRFENKLGKIENNIGSEFGTQL